MKAVFWHEKHDMCCETVPEPLMLARIAGGETDPSVVIALDAVPDDVRMFNNKENGCIKAGIHPNS